MSVCVQLIDEEIAYVTRIGNERNDSSLKKKSKSHFPERWEGEFVENDVQGAAAEYAVAKYLGLSRHLGVDVYDVADIDNTRIEIRWSRNKNYCKVKQRDINANRIVIGTHGMLPIIQILGWIDAHDAPYYGKESDPSDGRPHCWFIPELCWNKIETLTKDMYLLKI